MPVPTEVMNQDVCSIARRLTAFAVEMHESVSAGANEFGPGDIERLEMYLESWQGVFDWVTTQPKLDLPHSHPLTHTVAPMPAFEPTDNAAVDDVIRLLCTARDELLLSGSSKQAVGLADKDAERHQAVISRVAAFVEDYIKKILPLDMPETNRFTGA